MGIAEQVKSHKLFSWILKYLILPLTHYLSRVGSQVFGCSWIGVRDGCRLCLKKSYQQRILTNGWLWPRENLSEVSPRVRCHPRVWGMQYDRKLVELSKWVGTRESTRLTTGSDRVGLKFFYKFKYGLIFDPAYLEAGLNLWWARLIHQPANKGSHKYFLLSWTLYLDHIRFFFSQHIDNLYFCDFSLYLDCIKVYLDFN